MKSGIPGTTITEFLRDAPSRILQAGGCITIFGLFMLFFLGGAEIPGTTGKVFLAIGVGGGILMMLGAGLMAWHIKKLERLEKKQ